MVTDTGLPTSTSKPADGDSIQTCAPLPHVTAERALSRPPVELSPAKDAFGSTVRSRSVFSPTALADGKAAFASAATPVACGAAMDVPSRKRYEPPGQVE